MATKQLCAGLGSSHPWPHCKAFHPRGSSNLGQHDCMNTSGVFVISTPENENDFIVATPSSVNGFCVDMVLENWTESSIGVIPGNDPAFGESYFGWVLHHYDPRHYHLFFLDCPDSVAGAYFFPPIENLSPTCITAQFLGFFHRVGHASRWQILFGVFNTTLLQGQTIPPPIRVPGRHVFSVFAPAKWTPKKTPWICSQHDL